VTTLLIDADVICHQLAYKNTRNVSFDGEETIEVTQDDKAKADVESYVLELIDDLNAKNAILVLSDRGRNFRKELDSTYKANRTKPKPALWHVIRGLIESGDLPWHHAHRPRLEGDDVLGIMATRRPDLYTVVSIDKDMKGVPCRLYNPGKPERGVVTVSELDARLFHLSQVVTGDTVDNYPGLPGRGEDWWDWIVSLAGNDLQLLWTLICDQYVAKGHTVDRAIHQACLAYILQVGDYNESNNEVTLWTPQRYNLR
jgi:DNA polymerase-1